MMLRILLPLLLAGACVSALGSSPAGAEGAPLQIDLTTGRLNPDEASQGGPFTVWSSSETKKDPKLGGKNRGDSRFFETTTDYLYRGGGAFDPGDYVVGFLGMYNYYASSRIILSAGVGANYAAFRDAKRVVGVARSAGVAFRVLDRENLTLEARLRWSKYAAPGDGLSGLTPAVRLRWALGN
jgi:hypothetical protein